MESIETIEYRGFNIEICPDEFGADPREDFDNFGHMVCFHGRYLLGDKHDDHKRPVDFLESVLEDWHDTEEIENIIDESENPLQTLLDMFEEHAIVLPLYLYDHSGITMSTRPFSCPWDSGQVGWIYATHDEIRAEYGKLTEETMDRARSLLVGEVELYDHYITGAVCGYIIEPTERNKEIDCQDSCWGFYGYDFEENGLLEMARDAIDYAISEYRERVKAEKKRKKEMEQFMSFAWAT